MYASRIMEMADSRAIVQNPLHPYTIGLMNSVPDINNENQKITAIPGELPDLSKHFDGCMFCPRCSRAMAVCEKEKPELREIEPGHYCACHLYNSMKGENI